MENRQRRGAFSTFTMERYFCQIRVPYLDYELAEFLSHLPPKLRFQQRLYKQMIVHGYPEAAHVPWAYTRRPIGTRWKTEFAKEWYNYWSRKIRSKLSPKSSSLPIYAFRDNRRLLQEDRPFGEPVYQWLQSDRFDAEVFNPDGIREFLDDYYRTGGSGDDYILLGYLCGFVRADNLLLSGNYPTIPDVCNPARYGVAGPNARQ